ncbi:MAG: bifunctional glycosyltransferase family 2/GtrA family protein [Clostridia bacterium]|nr:bifunctional glycosyltransferase family 2/GtrA family protein [Clostridia bacterium]
MYAVIPAYRPDAKLFDIIEGLSCGGVRFVVVDDGSGAEFDALFDKLEKDHADCVTVLRYRLNCGKGHALKEGFAYIESVCSEDDGILTIDADASHEIEGAKRVIEAWKASPDCLVIGSRRFTNKVPFKNRLGMSITRSVFAVTSGARIHDTQSGLRAFSVKLIPELIKIGGERYDYEIAQLLHAAKQQIRMIEVPVPMDFTGGVRSSHFIQFKDSWLIFRMIIVFMLSSFSCFVIDYSLLLILASVFKHSRAAVETAAGEFRLPVFGMLVDTHMIALIIARAVSSFCNFILNRRIVFRTGSRAAIVRFYIVILGLLAANYGLLALVANGEGLPLWIAQLVVQAVLYPMSFILQRRFVFPDKGRKGAEGRKQ